MCKYVRILNFWSNTLDMILIRKKKHSGEMSELGYSSARCKFDKRAPYKGKTKIEFIREKYGSTNYPIFIGVDTI